MYKLSKYLIVVFVMLFSHQAATAQLFRLPKIQFIVNANLATPSNSQFKSNFKSGLGAEAGAGVGLGSTMLMGTIGVQNFGANSIFTGGNLNMTSIKGGIRQYFFMGHIFILGNIGTAAQKYSSNSTTGSSLITEYGAGARLLGLEVQATQSHWNQPLGNLGSDAFTLKLGLSIKI